jgi:hypothetical protein
MPVKNGCTDVIQARKAVPIMLSLRTHVSIIAGLFAAILGLAIVGNAA